MSRTAILATVLAMCLASIGSGQIYNEIEPNDNKAQALANPPVVLGGGHTSIVGNSTSSSGVGIDQYLVQMAPQALGIYRNQLVLTTAGAAGHVGTIRSISQLAAAPDTLAGVPWDGVVGAPNPASSDNAGQTSSASSTTPPRMNQWYSFGHPNTQFYYRVTGGTATADDYTATWSQTPVTPTNIGSFQPGSINFNWTGQGHTSDTDMWVYDANMQPIAGFGNDDASAALNGAPIATTAFQSYLTRDFAPGTYHLALTNFSFMNDQASASDDNFRTGGILEFPGVALNSSTTVNMNMAFTVTDANGSTPISATKTEAYEVLWFQFDVVPEPTTFGLVWLALPMLLRRRLFA